MRAAASQFTLGAPCATLPRYQSTKLLLCELFYSTTESTLRPLSRSVEAVWSQTGRATGQNLNTTWTQSGQTGRGELPIRPGRKNFRFHE